MARILVIDDDEGFGELAERTLRRAGHSVTFQNGPFGTVNILRSGGFDLVLLDVGMPALDGPRVVQLIRETSSVWETKILLYSSLDTASLREVAEGLDVNGYLSKSAPKHELLKTIQLLLAGPR